VQGIALTVAMVLSASGPQTSYAGKPRCPGSYERVAETLSNAGATHAIELAQGGSVSTHFVYQQKRQSGLIDSRIFASHYFRACASALLVVKLLAEGKHGAGAYVPVKEDSTLGFREPKRG